jgi:hypothetical protein
MEAEARRCGVRRMRISLGAEVNERLESIPEGKAAIRLDELSRATA